MTEIKFKCCFCKEEFADVESAEEHMIPTAERGYFKHPVVPIETCRFCVGCK